MANPTTTTKSKSTTTRTGSVARGRKPAAAAPRATVASYFGHRFPMPRTPRGLDSLRQHPDSDGCTFTAAELEAMGVRVPTGTSKHRFVVAMGDLCAYPSAKSHRLDYVWVGGSAWDRG